MWLWCFCVEVESPGVRVFCTAEPTRTASTHRRLATSQRIQHAACSNALTPQFPRLFICFLCTSQTSSTRRMPLSARTGPMLCLCCDTATASILPSLLPSLPKQSTSPAATLPLFPSHTYVAPTASASATMLFIISCSRTRTPLTSPTAWCSTFVRSPSPSCVGCS